MNNFGDVIKGLVLIVCGGLLDKKPAIHKENLVRYLRNGSTSSSNINGSKTKNLIIPTSIIPGRRPLVAVATEILEDLERKLELANEFDQIKNEQASSLTGQFVPAFEYHEDGSVKDFGKFIPVGQMIHIPKKTKPDLIQMIFEIYGKPIQKHLRETGQNTSKLSKEELDSAFCLKLQESAFLTDELFNLKIIDKKEFDQIDLLIFQLQRTYDAIRKEHKDVTQDDIITAYNHLEEAGFLSAKQCKYFKNKSLGEIITCEYPGCKNAFTKKRKTHKYCDVHSNSSQYRKHIRNRHKEQQN